MVTAMTKKADCSVGEARMRYVFVKAARISAIKSGKRYCFRFSRIVIYRKCIRRFIFVKVNTRYTLYFSIRGYWLCESLSIRRAEWGMRYEVWDLRPRKKKRLTHAVVLILGSRATANLLHCYSTCTFRVYANSRKPSERLISFRRLSSFHTACAYRFYGGRGSAQKSGFRIR